MLDIKVLGPGCANCHKLFETVERAVSELGMRAEVVRVGDIREIMKYTFTTPGLVVGGKLKHAGRPLPGLEEVVSYIVEEMK